MLWNGVSRMPRFRAYRWVRRASSWSSAAAASPPLRGGVGVNQYSARHPILCTSHGSACRSIEAFTPSAHRSPSAIIRSNASSVRTWSRVARIAASESALPESVPPMPPTSVVGRERMNVSVRSATSALIP